MSLKINFFSPSDVKDSAQTVPYTPNAKDPPLIKVVMNNLLPQAVVRIEKLDPGMRIPIFIPMCVMKSN